MLLSDCDLVLQMWASCMAARHDVANPRFRGDESLFAYGASVGGAP